MTKGNRPGMRDCLAASAMGAAGLGTAAACGVRESGCGGIDSATVVWTGCAVLVCCC